MQDMTINAAGLSLLDEVTAQGVTHAEQREAGKEAVREMVETHPYGSHDSESYLHMLTSWSQRPIDEYCERHGPEWNAEPLNAISNFFIIAAGFAILRMYRRDIVGNSGRHYPLFVLLIALVIALGTGSLAWHVFAVSWALWADLLPIIALIFVYQWAVLRLVFRWSRKESAAYLVAFGAVSGALIHFVGDRWLNGSVIYIPAVLALCTFGWRMKRSGKRGSEYMWGGVLTFLLSIFLRTMDMAVCPWLPIGTHYFWHIFNSVLVLLLAKSLILGYVGGMARKKTISVKDRMTM